MRPFCGLGNASLSVGEEPKARRVIPRTCQDISKRISHIVNKRGLNEERACVESETAAGESDGFHLARLEQ